MKLPERAVYSDVVNGGHILPKKAKYTMKDFHRLINEGWNQVDALFIINCSAAFYGTEVTKKFETAKFLTLCQLGMAAF